MSKSVFSIRMDYHNALSQAKELENIASSLGESDRELEGCIGEILSSSQSENADVFAGKTETVKGNIETVQRDILRIAETVRKIAERTYKAEMRAAEIARKRDYNG